MTLNELTTRISSTNKTIDAAILYIQRTNLDVRKEIARCEEYLKSVEKRAINSALEFKYTLD